MNPSLRKAAILITALDPSAADQLLDQMGERQAASVRNAVMELDDVAPAEQEAILAEFFGENPHQAEPVVLDLSSARSSIRHTEENAGPRFHFLHDAPPDELARRLHLEHPQLIALLAAHLPPAQSANVLEHLPSSLRKEVLCRLQDSEDAEPEALSDLERELERTFGGRRSSEERGQRYDHLVAILEHLERKSQPVPQPPPPSPEVDHPTWIEPTASRDMTHELSFDQLLSLNAPEFFAVFDEADPRVVMLALAGAPRRLFERYLAQFTADRAMEFERHLEQLRPLRLRDVEAAQQELATLAGRRLQAAKSAAESSRRFAAAG